MKEDQSRSLVARYGAFFLKRRRITILAVLIILVGGLFATKDILREGYPEITLPMGVITTPYVGASSEDIEKQVTDPLEDEIANLDGIKTISSSSGNGISSIVAEFEASEETTEAFRRLREATDRAQSELPEEAGETTVTEVGTASGFNTRMGVSGDASDEEVLEQARVMRDAFRALPDVSSVSIIGERDLQVQIHLEQEKLTANNVTPSQVSSALQAANVDIPGGFVEKDNGGTIPVRTLGSFNSIDQIRNAVITAGARGPVRLSDLGTVTEQREEQQARLWLGTRDDKGDLVGRDALFLDINKKSNANVTDMEDSVIARLQELRDENIVHEDIEAKIVFSDAEDVRMQINQLLTNGWQGLIIIFVVLVVFINRRGSVAVVAIVPFVFLFTILGLYIGGQSLNVMTLFALILTMGMLVDNAIVIVEAIQHHIDKGLKKGKAAVTALQETGPAIVAATITTVLVFVPMFFLPGVTGEFIKLMPITVVIAILGSLFIALTVTPLISSTLLCERRSKKTGQKKKDWRFVRWYGVWMTKLLKTKWRFGVILLALALFFTSMSLPATGVLGSEQWPDIDLEWVFVNVNIESNQPVSDLDAGIAKSAEALTDIPEVEHYSFVTEGSAFFRGVSGSGATSAFGIVRLSDPDERDRTNSEIATSINESFTDFDQSTIEAEAVSPGPPGAEYNIQYQIAGTDLETLQEFALEASSEIEEIEGIEDLSDGVSGETLPELRFDLQRDDLAAAGIPAALAGSSVRSYLTEEKVGSYQPSTGEETRDIVIAVPDVLSKEDASEISLQGITGTSVAVADVAEISEDKTLASVNHFNQQRYIEGGIKLKEDADPIAVQEELDEIFSEDRLLEEGFAKDAVSYRGQMAEDQESFASSMNAFLLAILLVYLVLVAQFKSFGQPFLILTTIPLALILVFPALAVFGEQLSFLASIGIVALAGVVVNDAIVYLSYINTLRKRNMTLHEAIVTAGKVRLKPILSTTITTAGGILPLTLTVPFWKGMGITLIFGLIMGMIGTLVIVPLLYKTGAGVTERIGKRLSKRFSS